jgi:hypothetical protein
VFPDRFSPRRLRRYLREVDEALEQAARSRFYISHDLRYCTEPDAIVLTGTIYCEGGIRIEVTERLRVLRESTWLRRKNNPLVELVSYENNAVLLNRGTIFRYNSPHEDHNQFHHVHRVDVLGGGEKTIDPLGVADVPSLRQLVNEAEEWYWAHLGTGPCA